MDVYGAHRNQRLMTGCHHTKTWIQIGLGNAVRGWMSSLATRARSQLPDCFHPTMVTMMCGAQNQVEWNRLLTSIVYALFPRHSYIRKWHDHLRRRIPRCLCWWRHSRICRPSPPQRDALATPRSPGSLPQVSDWLRPQAGRPCLIKGHQTRSCQARCQACTVRRRRQLPMCRS